MTVDKAGHLQVLLKGGLGNQLFQYSSGLYFSRKLNCGMSINAAYFRKPDRKTTSRELQLDNFFNPDESKDKIVFTRFPKSFFKSQYPNLTLKLCNSAILNDDNVGNFKWQNLTKNQTVFLNGYWQKIRYVNQFIEELKIFTTCRFDSPTRVDLENLIYTSRNSVSLHIRRGDYHSNSIANSYHGTLKLAYYAKAINTLELLVGDKCHYFIFTDDPEWALANICKITDSFSIISGSSKLSDIDEFLLMQRCNHHIIANSTFSWWAAFLSATLIPVCNKKSQIIFAPKEWFSGKFLSLLDIKEIFPCAWKII